MIKYIVHNLFTLKGRVRSKMKLSYMKSFAFRIISASINQSKSVTLLRGKRNKDNMSLSTSDCWIFASDGGYLKIRDTSVWKRQINCTGTSGSRVVIPTVRSASPAVRNVIPTVRSDFQYSEVVSFSQKYLQFSCCLRQKQRVIK